MIPRIPLPMNFVMLKIVSVILERPSLVLPQPQSNKLDTEFFTPSLIALMGQRKGFSSILVISGFSIVLLLL